jgi:hypothetical protein
MAKASDKAAKCANCGAGDFQDGHVVWNGPIRFKTPDQGSFQRGVPVEARACTACGHIALYLQNLPD